MRTHPAAVSPLLKIQIHDIESRLSPAVMGQRPGRSWLVLTMRGGGEIRTGGKVYPLVPRQMSWVPEGSSAEARFQTASRAFVAALPPDVLTRTLPAGAPGDDLQLYLKQVVTQDGLDPASLRFVETNIRTMQQEIFAPQPGSEQILSHLCSLVLIHLWRSLYSGAAVRPVPKSVVDRFFALERLHRAEHLSIGEYAERIGVTRDRLGAEVQRAAGMPPRAYLHQELIREARELLEVSSLQVAQVAYRLGFSEPGYFNRFFQRHVGQTPGKYRKQFLRLRQKEPDTFAAWP